MSGPLVALVKLMIARLLLILASLIAMGIIGAFLLYVSALSLLAVIAVGIGLLATWFLGYSAGSLAFSPAPRAKRLQNLAVINTPADIISFPQPHTVNRQSARESVAEELCQVTPIR